MESTVAKPTGEPPPLASPKVAVATLASSSLCWVLEPVPTAATVSNLSNVYGMRRKGARMSWRASHVRRSLGWRFFTWTIGHHQQHRIQLRVVVVLP